MNTPLVSIIIPTYNRPHLLPRAVKSALAQTVRDIEVIVVDDASPEPVELPDFPEVRVERQSINRGIAVNRNHGARLARGGWITYLDDDDELLPHAVAVCLEAIRNSELPPPVAVLSGLQVVTSTGAVVSTRLPPTLPRGKYYSLEEIEPSQSFLCKQTLFIEREVLLGIGGYDETLSSREHTEMFLRLNPVCSLLGLSTITYRQYRHEGPRLSRDPGHRQIDFQKAIGKHREIFRAHPKMYADFVYSHAKTSYSLGQKKAAILCFFQSFSIHPLHFLALVMQALLLKSGKMRQKLQAKLAKLQ